MEIKAYIEEQIKQLDTTKRVDLARVEGFYNGAKAALDNVMTYLASAEQEQKEQKQDKKLKVAKNEE